MAANVWKKLGSLDLSPSTITLHAWDGCPSQPIDLYHNYLVTISKKTILIDIKVIDYPLYYNILLGHSYTYSMSIVASTVFRKICFPHNGKIITISHLNYYDH